jgi:hypothetical protein
MIRAPAPNEDPTGARARRLPRQPVARPERTRIAESGASQMRVESDCPIASPWNGRIIGLGTFEVG